MAYYTALINAWNSVQQPPAGVTGTGLTGTMTTQQKLDAVNAWTVLTPQVANIEVTKAIGAIQPVDFMALTSLQFQLLQFLMQSGPTVYAPPSGTIRVVFAQIFAGKATTLANLNALLTPFDNATQNWCAANGYPVNSSGTGNLSISDTLNAGLV